MSGRYGKAVQIATIENVLELLNLVVCDLWQEENAAARSRALLMAADTAIRALQVGDLETRLARLEQMVKDAGP